MSALKRLSFLLRRLSTSKFGKKENVAQVSQKQSPPKPFQGLENEEEILSLISKAKHYSQPHIGALTLNSIERHFQEDWNNIYKWVHKGVTIIFKNFLTKDDTYARIKNTTYILMLGKDDATSGMKKISNLQSKISRTFISGDLSSDDHSLMMKQDPAVSSLSEVLRLISNNVKPELSYSKFKKEHESSQQNSALENTSLPAEEINTDIPGKKIKIQYVPIEDLKSGMISGYMCVPKDKETYGLSRNEIDEIFLQKAQEEASKLSSKKSKKFMICPVHYNTLIDLTRNDFLLKYCPKITASEKERLRFLINGIPSKFSDSQIQQLSQKIKPYASMIGLEVNLLSASSRTNYQNLGIDFIGCDLRTSSLTEDLLNAPLKKLLQLSVKEKVSTIISGCYSNTLKSTLKTLGFSHVGGKNTINDIDTSS